jgi:hypothetical protein
MSASEAHVREALRASMLMNGDPLARRDERSRAMPTGSQETQNVLTDREIAQLHSEVNQLRRELDALKSERDRALLWGVMVLGAAVLGMGTWIFNLLASKLR